jgi:hypothetical protein
MHEVRFYLNISAEEYLRYYRGEARFVSIRGHDGRRVQFPAERLRPFVRHDGVRGQFVLRFDGQHRFVEMQRIGEL